METERVYPNNGDDVTSTIYNFSGLVEPHEQYGLKPVAILQNSGDPDSSRSVASPHFRGIWPVADRDAPPRAEKIIRAVQSTDPTTPIIFNGEWGQRLFGSASWDGRSHDVTRDVVRTAYEACGGLRPIGVYGVPVSKRRTEYSPLWASRFRRFVHRPFRARDERGRYESLGAATYLAWCCPSLYYPSRARGWGDFVKATTVWASRVQRLWQRPIVPFISVERFDTGERWHPRDFGVYAQHVLSLSNVNAAILWLRHSETAETAKPYLEVLHEYTEPAA